MNISDRGLRWREIVERRHIVSSFGGDGLCSKAEVAQQTMRVSVGIFACNEESNIAHFIEDLLHQSLFDQDSTVSLVEVVCIANGCSDRTAEVAHNAFEERLETHASIPEIRWRVDSLEIANKANAWNYYVHEASMADAAYLFCMDADIRLPQRDCLVRMLQEFEASPGAQVVVDAPIKDIELCESSGLLSRLNRRVTCFLREKRNTGKRVPICGQLFVGRATTLRRIHLPHGLVRVMDGFIRAMVVTDSFTSEEKEWQVREAKGCFHVFEAYKFPLSVFKHNRKLLVGIVVNSVVYEYLWSNSTDMKDAGELIAENNRNTPEWLSKLLEERLTRTRRAMILRAYVSAPLRNAVRARQLRRIKKIPVALVQSLWRLFLAISANRALRNSQYDW